MLDCRIEWRACFLCSKVCLKGMFMLTVDIRLTINFCRISTEFSIENDLNLGFNRAPPFLFTVDLIKPWCTIFRT